jgi:hypothetical protein
MSITLYHWTERDRVNSIMRHGLRRCSWWSDTLVTWACSGEAVESSQVDVAEHRRRDCRQLRLFGFDIELESVAEIYSGFYIVLEDIPPHRLRRCRVVRGKVEVMRCRENTG